MTQPPSLLCQQLSNLLRLLLFLKAQPMYFTCKQEQIHINATIVYRCTGRWALCTIHLLLQGGPYHYYYMYVYQWQKRPSQYMTHQCTEGCLGKLSFCIEPVTYIYVVAEQLSERLLILQGWRGCGLHIYIQPRAHWAEGGSMRRIVPSSSTKNWGWAVTQRS